VAFRFAAGEYPGLRLRAPAFAKVRFSVEVRSAAAAHSSEVRSSGAAVAAARQAQRSAQPEASARWVAPRPREEPAAQDAAAEEREAQHEVAAVARHAAGVAEQHAEEAAEQHVEEVAQGAAVLRAVRRAVPGVRVALPSAVACLPCRVRLPAPSRAERFGRAMERLRIASL
jgi:hypothetical protein